MTIVYYRYVCMAAPYRC